jgi:photosystem II stability/assembly factor-like uncharacterized protein
MKTKILLSVLFLVLISTSITAQTWHSGTYPGSPLTSDKIRNMHFFNSNEGVCVLDVYSNYIKKTTNRGDSWSSIIYANSSTQLSEGEFFDVFMFTNMKFIGVGQKWNVTPAKAFVGKTDDGGQTWIYSYTDSLSEFLKVNFYNEFIGYAIGKDASYKYKIAKTLDGGNSWSFYNLSSFNFSNPYSTDYDVDISIIDENNAFILCKNILFKTTDGGTNWEQIKTTLTTSFKSISFFDVNNGYLLESFLINKTTDGGQTWTTCNLTNPIYQNDMFFVNQNIGYSVLNNGSISKTTDGGATWDNDTIITNISL